MNFNFLGLLGFIGSVICARVPFSGLAEFERKLSTAYSGECVSDIVDECENLPDYLDGMASKPANYVIPITDKYKLYNFFSGVIYHYEKAEENAGSTGFENANRLFEELPVLTYILTSVLRRTIQASLEEWAKTLDSLKWKLAE